VVQSSHDKLCFIKYAATGTFRPRWYLFRIAETQTRTSPSIANPVYTVEFVAKHETDLDLCDPDSRWWPEWYECGVINDGTPKYGRRITFSPRAKPNPDMFTIHSDNTDLAGDAALVGPFDYAETASRRSQIIAAMQWAQLGDTCMVKGIVSPQMNTRTRQRLSGTATTHTAHAVTRGEIATRLDAIRSATRKRRKRRKHSQSY
jgi:hypothetical protein